MKNYYRGLSVSDFDRYDCLKIAKWYFLALAYVLRGYLIWLMSVTNMQNSTEIIAIFYPDPKLFYLNLFSGCLGLLVVLVWSLRKPKAAHWVVVFWPRTRILLIVALAFDVIVLWGAYWQEQLMPLFQVIAQTLIAALLAFACLKSKRLTLNLSEFPQSLPEKDRKTRVSPH